MKRLIPAGLLLAILVVVMIITQPIPEQEDFIMPIIVEQPSAVGENQTVKVQGLDMTSELDEAIAEYYQIINSLMYTEDPALRAKLVTYHDQWLGENAYKFYEYRNFIETNFKAIELLGLNPVEMITNVNNDIKVMENNKKLLMRNGA